MANLDNTANEIRTAATKLSKAALVAAIDKARRGAGKRTELDTEGWSKAQLVDYLVDFTVRAYYRPKLQIEQPIEVRLVTRALAFTCTLFPGGQVRYESPSNGSQVFSSPAQAMGRITAMETGKAYNGARAYQCFVFEAEDGAQRPLDLLREGSVGYAAPVQGMAQLV